MNLGILTDATEELLSDGMSRVKAKMASWLVLFKFVTSLGPYDRPKTIPGVKKDNKCNTSPTGLS